MNRLLLIVVGWLAFHTIRAENILTLSSVSGIPNEEVTITVGLDNSDALSAFQLSIPLDELLTYVDGSATLTERAANHQVTAGVKDGLLNIMVYSLSMTAIKETSGAVVSFRLKLGNQPTAVDLTPSKCVMTRTDGTKVEGRTEKGSVSIRCAKAQYSNMDIDFGHVPIRETYEQTLSVTNVGNEPLTVTALNFSDVNAFSSTTPLPLTIAVGESRELNVTYKPTERGSVEKSVQVVCNSISKLNTIALKADPFAVNELHVQNASGVSDEEVTVSMRMNNMDGISGCQVEFEMPEVLDYVDGSFTLADRKVDHVSSVSYNDRVLRIIVYSPTDKALTGADGEIGSFKVKLAGRNGVQLTPSKTVLTSTINKKVENVVSAVYGGYIDIQSPRINGRNSLNFGAVPVTEKAKQTFNIFNYGNAPLTINRIVFDDENLSIEENLPLVVPANENKMVTVVYSSVEQKAFESTMQIYSNDPEQRLWNVKVTGSRFAPNYLEVSIKDVSVDDILSVDVSLDTYDPITGLQFDLTFPYEAYEVFDGNVVLEERTKGMTAIAREINKGIIRYFCYFLDGSGIAAGMGKVFSIQMKPVEGVVAEGSYTVQVKNIKMGTSSMTDKYAGIANITTNFNVRLTPPFIQGDVNNDGTVDISDYIGVANHILGNTPEGFNEAAADVNNDGAIDISDYIGVANIILTGKP